MKIVKKIGSTSLEFNVGRGKLRVGFIRDALPTFAFFAFFASAKTVSAEFQYPFGGWVARVWRLGVCFRQERSAA